MSYHNINTSTYTSIYTSTETKLIKSVNIDTSILRTTSSNRFIQVRGDTDAIFSLQVSRSSDNRFYNFTTNTFSATYNSQNRLENLKPGSYPIFFPAASGGDTYTVYIWPEPHFNTELSFGENRLRHVETIEQTSTDTIITFSTDTSISTVSATSMGTSSGSSLDSYTQSNAPTITMDNAQLTVPSAAGDYGVFIKSDNLFNADNLNEGYWDSSALYWETGNYVANGAGTGSTSLILTSVDDLYVGMQLSYVNSVFQTALRTINAIDTTTKTVTLNGAETWSDTHVIKFRAYGTSLITKAININLTLSNPTVKLGQVSTTLRTAIESGQATANVNGTKGVSVDTTVRCSFLDKSTSSSVGAVSATTPSVAAGDITIANSEFTSGGYVGDIIYIDGSSNLIYLSGDIAIGKYPTANQTIYIDISKFLTIGTTA